MTRRRSQARRFLPDAGTARRLSRRRPSRMPVLLGWVIAAASLVGLALIVGRPAGEQEVLSSTTRPTPGPVAIVFGTGLDGGTGRAIGETDRFRRGDAFAYSVTLPRAPGTDTILVEVVRVVNGIRDVVQEPSVQHVQPDARRFAFQVRTADLIAAWGTGTFEMRIYLHADDDRPAATGRFELLASP